jgi:hypothetical protein
VSLHVGLGHVNAIAPAWHDATVLVVAAPVLNPGADAVDVMYAHAAPAIATTDTVTSVPTTARFLPRLAVR